MSRLALVQMPFASVSTPSLGLSLLKAQLGAYGHTSDIHYFNNRFADLVGDPYALIARGYPTHHDLLGDWVFSEDLWGASRQRDLRYLTEIIGGKGNGASASAVASESVLKAVRGLAVLCRGHVGSFLQWCVDSIKWSEYDIVGFSSTFQQHIASLALAQRLRQRYPNMVIVIGGANCEGDMGVATRDHFEFIDAVFSGESENTLLQFVAGLERDCLPDISAIAYGQRIKHLVARGAQDLLRPAFVSLDALPYPNFDDFIEAWTPRATEQSPQLLFETSRGCWWGQKHHCTFCGLNGESMHFRAKSPQRALDEIVWLLERYGAHTRRINATDNIIPYEYFDSFLPKLAELGLDLEIFYETKANLKESQIIKYKLAGLRSIQPGIESLVTEVLSLMRKGITALQNVQTMKLTAQHGVRVSWNYLWGFPGENARAYTDQPALLALLHHLEPPETMGTVRFDRFSPYGERPEQFGISDLRPFAAYSFTYPALPESEIRRHAYFFRGEFANEVNIQEYAPVTRAAIELWRRSHDQSMLHRFSDASGNSAIVDTRNEPIRIVVLREDAETILRRMHTIGGMSHHDHAEMATGVNEMKQVSGIVHSQPPVLIDLLQFGILIREQSKYLSLVLSATNECRPRKQAAAVALEALSEGKNWFSTESCSGAITIYSPDTGTSDRPANPPTATQKSEFARIRTMLLAQLQVSNNAWMLPSPIAEPQVCLDL